jgi:predicted kinase
MVIIIFGLPGSGKSYFAKALAVQLQATYINSDNIRQSLEKHNSYSTEDKYAVYDLMLKKMLSAATKHKTVIVDATFYKNRLKKRFSSYIPSSKRIFFIEIVASEELIHKRLSNKRDDSDADFAVYKKIKSEWEEAYFPHLVLESTNRNIREMLHKTLDYIQIHLNPAEHEKF